MPAKVSALDISQLPAKRVLFDESRILKSHFSRLKPAASRGVTPPFGDGPGEHDQVTKAILKIGHLDSIDEPIPVQIGKRRQYPGQCLSHARRHLVAFERGQDECRRIHHCRSIR